MAGFSLYTGDIGTVLPFRVTELASSLIVASATSTIAVDLSGTVVTMVTDDGIERVTSLVSAAVVSSVEVSSTVGFTEYTVSSGDFPTPTFQQGRLRVKTGANTFYTGTFDVNVLRITF